MFAGDEFFAEKVSVFFLSFILKDSFIGIKFLIGSFVLFLVL